MIKKVILTASLVASMNANAFVDQFFQTPKCAHLDEGLVKVEKQGATYKGYLNNQLFFQGTMNTLVEGKRATLTATSNPEMQMIIQMKDSSPYLVLIDEYFEVVNGVEKLISKSETFVSMFNCN